MMFIIRLADLNIGIEVKYDYTKEICSPFIIKKEVEPDFCVFISSEDIDNEGVDKNSDRGYLESLAVYRKIAEKLPFYNGFLMHGAIIDTKIGGLAFLAKSGVGKSTHISFWKEKFAGKVSVINGDKPVIRVIDEKVYAYGTPWAGKENWYENKRCVLKKICFIKRNDISFVNKLEKKDVVFKLLDQIYLPKDKNMYLKTLSLVDSFIKKCYFYDIFVNKNPESAKIIYDGVKND